MSYINREEAIRLIMEYQGGAMDKPTARKVLEEMDGVEICEDTISRQAAIEAVYSWLYKNTDKRSPSEVLKAVPPAQQQYEPVRVEDFAKTMSRITPYSVMDWHGMAFTLMKGMGFVICKKTM